MPGFCEKQFIGLSEGEASLLRCSICCNIFDNPVVSHCGHSFCKTCLQHWIKEQHTKCPTCEQQFTKDRTPTDQNLVVINEFVFKPDFASNEVINDLKTKCEFEFNGCEDVIVFGLLDSHLQECEHRICLASGLIATRFQSRSDKIAKDDWEDLKNRLKIEVEQLEKDVAELKYELAVLRRDTDWLRSEGDDLIIELKQLKNKNIKLKSKLDNSEQILDDLKEQGQLFEEEQVPLFEKEQGPSFGEEQVPLFGEEQGPFFEKHLDSSSEGSYEWEIKYIYNYDSDDQDQYSE